MGEVAVNAFGDILVWSMIPVFVCCIHHMTIGACSWRTGDVAGHVRYIYEYAHNNKQGDESDDDRRRFESRFHKFSPGTMQ